MASIFGCQTVSGGVLPWNVDSRFHDLRPLEIAQNRSELEALTKSLVSACQDLFARIVH